jgi:rod shape-determining protein MreC
VLRERANIVSFTNVQARLAARRLGVPFLVLLALLLIVLGKADVLIFERIRIVAADTIAPMLAVLSEPAAAIATGTGHVRGLLNLYDENQRLREANDRLLQWQDVARRLAAENRELRALTAFHAQGANFAIAAQVIANSGGAFARNVLVDVGTRDGVARGQAGVTGEGLVGRVAEVGERTARLLLLTDLNSRIPVVLESSRERAVMAGDNSDQPRLLYLPVDAAIKVGERIVTGGADGVFPPDLPVGVVASIDGDVVRVESYAELARLDYVRILDLGLSAFLPQSAVPPPKTTKGTKAAETR